MSRRPSLSPSLVLCCALTSLVLVLSACGPLDEEGPGNDEAVASQLEPLVNGAVHYGHPAVGALVNGGSLCTATLVGQRTVLTAAHCVQPGGTHRFVVNNTYWLALSAERHPGYSTTNTNNDVAVVLLKDAPPVKAASITTKPPTVGQALTLLGYGATTNSGGGSGTKRIGTNKVAYLTSSRIVISGSGGTDANLCFGDSGGPSFATINDNEVQVGVHSTISGTCGQQGHDMRVDAFADWIRSTAKGDLAEDGKPSPLDDTEAPTVSITSPVGGAKLPHDLTLQVEAKISDDQHVSEATLFVDGKSQGTRTQPPYTFSLKLETGEHSLKVVARDLAGNEGSDAIKVTVLPPLQFGELCDKNEACASGMCASQGDRVFCTESCDPNGGSGCPEAAECLSAGDRYVCGAPPATLDDPAAAGGSGCAVGAPAGGAAPAALLLLVGLLALLRRRRR